MKILNSSREQTFRAYRDVRRTIAVSREKPKIKPVSEYSGTETVGVPIMGEVIAT